MLDILTQGDPADPVVYERVSEMVDIDDFIDYEAAQVYFDNTDWPGNNIKFWRPRPKEAAGAGSCSIPTSASGSGTEEATRTIPSRSPSSRTALTGPTSVVDLPAAPADPEPGVRPSLREPFRHAPRHELPGRPGGREDHAMQAALDRDMHAHLARWGGSVAAWKSSVASSGPSHPSAPRT